jgi:NADPH:quinone reductase-like Zn-dependent oxidoreductase
MLAAYIEAFDSGDPASVVLVGERPPASAPDPSWAIVTVRAASLNQHDLFSARGVGLAAERLPMILGMDAAGIDEDGNEVIAHTIIQSERYIGEELLDPGISSLSEVAPGTFAEQVAVPRRNLISKPEGLSFEEAACLPTAWLTAYGMLFDAAPDLRPGDIVLVQGAAGGVASGLIALGRAAGLRMWVTGRTPQKRSFAASIGAERTFEPGARLPERVAAVMDSVGAPTWSHSLKCLRKGGTMVVAGATGGYLAQTEVARLFVNRLKIVGTNMGTREDLLRLAALVVAGGVKPPIDRTFKLEDAPAAFRAMQTGELLGKIVLTP